MSRGYGRVQNAILDVAEKEGANTNGIPYWLAIEDIALHVYETDQPSASQREAIRRAAHNLANLGEVEVLRTGVSHYDRDERRDKSFTYPPRTFFGCPKFGRNNPGEWECEGCDLGIPVTTWGRSPRERGGHYWPTERVVTRPVAWGTSALRIRLALTTEQRDQEEAERAKFRARIRGLIGKGDDDE